MNIRRYFANYDRVCLKWGHCYVMTRSLHKRKELMAYNEIFASSFSMAIGLSNLDFFEIKLRKEHFEIV